MKDQKSARICITLSPKLLRQLDAIVHDTYTSRSDAIRKAVQHWIKSEARLLRVAAGAAEQPTETTLVTAETLLTSEQLVIFKEFQHGQATVEDLFKMGITPQIQIELMTLGEM